MAAVNPAGPEPTIRSFGSVRPSWLALKAGPPVVRPTAAPPKSIWRSPSGAGAAGAATPVSPEKSIERPPNGTAGAATGSSADVSVSAADLWTLSEGRPPVPVGVAGFEPLRVGAPFSTNTLVASGGCPTAPPGACCLLIDAS